MSNSFQPGMNARLFPANWRPATQEIAFAAEAGFRTIQFNGQEQGIDATYLGSNIHLVAEALQNAGITPVMEIVVRLIANGRTQTGLTPIDVLQANLPAITTLGCSHVHWHLAPAVHLADVELRQLEQQAVPQLQQALALMQPLGVVFGLEHNEPDIPLFANPAICARTLQQVDGLGLVWDLNHTLREQVGDFLAMADRISMLHVSDTPLPEVNYHLPLGLGNIDFPAYFAALEQAGFRGPAILEIGGLPKSGGYGRDTDAALRDSLVRLLAV